MEDNNKYYRSRHFQKLLHRYEHAAGSGQVPYMEADELTDIAEYYMTQKQDEKANQAIRAAIDMHPDSVDPQIFIARQKMFYGELDEARRIIDAITEQDDLEVIYLRAELLIKEGRTDEASDFLLHEMQQTQDSLDSYLYDCTSIFMDYDQWEMADKWIERLREAYPTHPNLPIMKAEILMGLDRFEEALPMLQDIIEANPYDSEAWNFLAETQVALGNYTEATEAADFSLAINPEDSGAIIMKANACLSSAHADEAAALYEHYLRLQPDDLSAQISLAMCYTSGERYQEAIDILADADRNATKQGDKDGELTQICQLMAFAQSRLDHHDEALRLMEKLRHITDETKRWWCDMTEGDIHLHAGNTDKAEKLFTQALQGSPERGETLFHIALSYSDAGYHEAAIELLEDVWTLFGTEDGKFVVPHIANCYLRLGNWKEFLSFLQFSVSCDREATIQLFHDRFPGIPPEEYYARALQQFTGQTD